ncbi:protein of unknown function [Pseudidiomarina planktonica]|uniref:DUF4377 domain-containing protein n=1 Tax=Pseudidiomarina planktonica TaxID=1323738 RepID=A0A1Y6EF07_9GAMM|nr:DUF4377 domain-containing protein [Pseudidiomarina planktonica]RUO66020.1 DUF4377 domain-containing protein [Pseudidiomarina planktonica]SMQ61046.1 protein of unknown function [Pseudidiomarina planktonica]
MEISINFRRCALLGAAFFSSLLVGCGDITGGDDRPERQILILTVSDKPELCPLQPSDRSTICSPSAYEKDSGQNRVYSNSISGFTHEFGVAYELRVRRDPYEDDIADGPDADYTLLETLNTTQVAQSGDIYEYDIPLDGSMFSVEDGNYFFGRYQFNCGEGVDCQQLVDMDGSRGLVTIEFTYVGGEVPITLTYWN